MPREGPPVEKKQSGGWRSETKKPAETGGLIGTTKPENQAATASSLAGRAALAFSTMALKEAGS